MSADLGRRHRGRQGWRVVGAFGAFGILGILWMRRPFPGNRRLRIRRIGCRDPARVAIARNAWDAQPGSNRCHRHRHRRRRHRRRRRLKECVWWLWRNRNGQLAALRIAGDAAGCEFALIHVVVVVVCHVVVWCGVVWCGRFPGKYDMNGRLNRMASELFAIFSPQKKTHAPRLSFRKRVHDHVSPVPAKRKKSHRSI
jgi:hypothetical protein